MIFLGNQSVSQIEERIGFEFPSEIREFMKLSHEPSASNIPKGKWHCFDIPFNLVCGDIETATKIFNSVKERSDECREILQISIQN